jgi:hypothetical protein
MPTVPVVKVSHCCQLIGRDKNSLGNPVTIHLADANITRIAQKVNNSILTFGDETINLIQIALESDANLLTFHSNASDAGRLLFSKSESHNN